MSDSERPELSSSGNVIRPVERDYSDRVAHKGKDTDVHARLMRIRALAWAVPAGAVMGAATGLRTGHFLIGMLLGAVIVPVLAIAIVESSGKAGTVLYNPSGKTTPRDKEYSQAKSLVMRGDYQGAVDQYELVTIDDPGDAVPYIEIARIKRDHLNEPEEAVRWYRKAMDAERISQGQRILAQRELVELYVHRTGQPGKAAPYLARMVEECAGTVDGDWAEREYKIAKAAIAAEMGRGPEPEIRGRGEEEETAE